MKHIIGLLVLMFGTYIATAQYYDSVSFVNAGWSVQKIDRKVKLYRFHFNNKNLFEANENISYIKIKPGRANEFDIAAEPQKLRTVSDFSKEKKATATINGNFFDVKNGGAVDFTKVDGVVINENRTGKNEKLGAHQKAAVVINNGELAIKKWDGLVNWPEWLKEPDVMLNGPLLLINRQNETLDSNSFSVTRHPRTCVGVTKRGHVIMLVVDGRNANSAGMSLFELTKIMRWLGCVSAINFDGGGSSTLWAKEQGVVNYPTDNRKWDHDGERKVANVLYLKRRK
ncbi:phosphodiester glycosidase family protein [Niabella ginsengisoli]|uniref:Phosphodiester glycosidase family protein n=1 Tax=Niabella ginsengisoli TaxID=522298 RepID=A0ABS9SKY3_9BACT|nr:phosphodiester glycosidase family protein [Niabella ginsengisoli]MCH5599054.1 phosphodiester glycosidase family protein [Niabella ginsengisoli]